MLHLPLNYRMSLYFTTISLSFLSRTSRLFYFKYLLDKWKGYLFSNNSYYLDSFQSPFFIITTLQRTLLLLVHIFRVIESNIRYTNLPQVIILSTNWGIWLSNESILLISICAIWISGLPVSISSPSCSIHLDHLYETLISMPDTLLNDEWLGMIVPGFQYRNDIKYCTPFKDCVEGYSLSIWLKYDH